MKTWTDVHEILNEMGIFTLATVDGDQPKSRPIGVHELVDGKLYFGVGDFKDVYQQMLKNPKVEIVALKAPKWLRITGTAVFEKDSAIADALMEKAPRLKTIYNKENGRNIAMFHLENGTCQFRTLLDVDESFDF